MTSLPARLRGALARITATGGPPPPRGWALKAAAITFATGIAILALIGALVLTEAPPSVVGSSTPGVKAVGVRGAQTLGSTSASPSFCQPGEALRAGVSAVRLSIWGFFGARVRLVAYEGGHVVTEGSRGANWTSDSVTVPVRALQRTHSHVTVCFAIGPNSENLLLLGARSPKPNARSLVAAADGTPLAQVMKASSVGRAPGRLTIEYLTPGPQSWWSQLLTVARHMGLGRAYSGTWIALLVALMMAAVAVLAVRLSIKEIQ